ncbi:MAG: glycosyl hydrolase 115 family protein [Lachnospiraceae bacterium]|nr:glycosyl hydrolase 115 family protein [Lachnospiraceae bacterium]
MKNFVIESNGEIKVYLASAEDSAVRIAVNNFCKDIEKICGAKVCLTQDKSRASIIVETVQECDKEAHRELLDLQDKLRWEAYSLKVSEGKLYITGSDRRGTIYGIYELSNMWGVSPWYWFADVPVKKRNSISLADGYSKVDYPSVQYRGIFINDEEELEAWAIEYMKEATIGPKTYEKIFEFLLRLKANYIWPAMHVNAFNMDKENGRMAHEMGMVVGTSHCDMLLRSNQNEWKPWVQSKGYEGVEYDYSIKGRNREIVKEYWTESIQQNRDYEVCYTVGMRGIHDSGFVTRALSEKNLSEEELKQEKIKLLEKVIADQRELLYENTGRRDQLQAFVPYKEVMLLYDAGLKVPEDVTLIWANDNFGYMRRYPSKEEQKRKGGHGLYYHASYWAHPGMSYLFFNSTPLAHMKNELKKAYENGIQRMWVLNVGAIKPLEIDIEFFITYAWEINRNEVKTSKVSDYIANFVNRNFSGGYGKEAAEIYERFSQVANVRKVEHMKANVFSQTAYGNEAAKRMSKLQELFDRTAAIHKALKDEEREAFFQMFAMKIYAAYFVNASYYYADRSTLMYNTGLPQAADTNLALSRWMDDHKRELLHYYNEIMCGGKWNKILTPESFRPPCMALHPAGKPALVIEKDDIVKEDKQILSKLYTAPNAFCENDGYISILAQHFERNSCWNELEHLGRYEGSLMEADGGLLEYEFSTVSEGSFLLELYRFPTLNSKGRLRIGISIDDGEIMILESEARDEWCGSWKQNVMNNVEKMYLQLPEMKAGKHELTVHSIDKYIAFSKIVIYTEEFTKSNLGPSESYHEHFNPNPYRGSYEFNPDRETLDEWCLQMFQCDKVPLPEVIYADKAYWSKDRLFLKNETRKQDRFGEKKYACDAKGYKNVFAKFGEGIITEKQGVIAWGAEYALENSQYAFCKPSKEGILWEHTQSETNGRTGIAMHVAEDDLFWDDMSQAPSINYRVNCSGGSYNVWLLLKYDDDSNGRCTIAIDDVEIPQAQMYNGGRLFNYGTKQNWVWMIVTETELTAGEHLFSICARASQFRVDRIYLTKGEEHPPIDAEWIEAERKN